MPRAKDSRTFQRIFLCLITATICLAFMERAVFAAEKVDQSNLPEWGGGWTHINPDPNGQARMWQTFTPNYSNITAVEIDILTVNIPQLDDIITVEIAKDGQILASTELNVRYGYEGLLRFDFAEAVAVVPGELYELKVHDTGLTRFGWRYASNTYDAGSRYVSATERPGSDWFFQTYSLEPHIIYVDDDAAGANDGSSWEDAYVYLQDALADANSAEKPVEIRVAQGIYKPDQGVNQIRDDREVTFRLINGVVLKGGFAGLTEPDPNILDVELYETILSGDLQSNDVPLSLESFFACFTGPIVHLENGCEIFDFDGDNDIDDSDMTALLNEYNYSENSHHVVTGSGTDPNAVIDGFIVTGGNAEPYLPIEPIQHQPAGGGMYNFLGNPKVLNCTFRGNLAGNGGGIYNIGSNPRLFNCIFYKNVAREITSQSYDMIFVEHGHGGALFNATGCSPEIIECKFIGNSAYNGGGVYNYGSFPMLNSCIFEGNRAETSGGGISNRRGSEPTLRNCVFISNNAHSGAGIENSQSSPILTECIFNGNVAERSGGGVANYDSKPVLTGCRFIGNQSSVFGGGIYNKQSNPAIQYCVFAGNSTRDGGGIYAYLDSNPTLINCTFADNLGEKGRALNSDSGNKVNNIKLINCILWDGDNEISNDDSSVITITYSNIQGDWEGEGNIDEDPLFADPNNGDYHLKSQTGRWDPKSQSWVVDDVTSPCIDAGDPNMPVGDEPEPNGGRINMGAYGGTLQASKSYILSKIIYVDDDAVSLNDGSSWQNAYNFLQDALADAKIADKPVEIRVAQGTYTPDKGANQTPGDKEATFQLINGITIIGGYAGIREPDPNERNVGLYETILSGDLNNDDVQVSDPCDLYDEPTRTENSYNVVTAFKVDETTVLEGFVITGGNAKGPVLHDEYHDEYRLQVGGGMYNKEGDPTLSYCIFAENSAPNGGGLCNSGGNPILTNCVFKANFAKSLGGGMYNSWNPSYQEQCTPTLIKCTFTANVAENGGGMFNETSSPLINDCVFISNFAGWSGGGICNINKSNPTINFSKFIANFVIYYGGGLHNDYSSPMLYNCTIIGNKTFMTWSEGGGIMNWSDSSPILVNCTLCDNYAYRGGGIYNGRNVCAPELKNCIVWGNMEDVPFPGSAQIREGTPIVNYCCVQNWDESLGGEGNINIDPCFVGIGYWTQPTSRYPSVWIDGDYHLKSEAGRWDTVSESWVIDDVTSPCIDVGDPNTPVGDEPEPNGGRINMGAYGGTAEASKSYTSE